MKAIVVHKPGGYDRLQVEEVESLRVESATDVLVRVTHVGVNYADCLVRLGLYNSAKDLKQYPIVPGFDFSGVVQAVGGGVKNFTVGDKVFGVTLFGAYQTEVVIDQDYIRHVPLHMSLAVAASLPTNFLTAYYILHHSAAIQRGERLLVRSIAGGVGSWLAILGLAAGALVEGTVSTERKREALLRSSKLMTGGTLKTNVWLEKSFEESSHAFDVIANAKGGVSIGKDFDRLFPRGRLVLYGFHGMVYTSKRGTLSLWSWVRIVYQYLRTSRVHPFALVNQNKAVIGFNLSYLFGEVGLYDSAMKKLLELVESGVALPPVTEVSFTDAAHAHRLLESGETIGKLVLIVPK